MLKRGKKWQDVEGQDAELMPDQDGFIHAGEGVALQGRIIPVEGRTEGVIKCLDEESLDP